MRSAILLLAGALLCGAALDDATRRLSRDIFRELIEINTTDSVGSTTRAAEAMAKRLIDAGFPAADVQVLGPNDRKGNMVARLRGTGAQKPILIIGHLDVVEARREDWTTDPFQFVEKDGYFYGRGTQDMKVDDAILVTTFIRFQREGYRPDRDLILALTADEEGGKFERRRLAAEESSRPDRRRVRAQRRCRRRDHCEREARERGCGGHREAVRRFRTDRHNPGGHSSLPMPDNAIYHLADALATPGAFAVSGRAERHHAHLFRTPRAARKRADQGRHERHSAHAARSGRRGALDCGPALQLHAAHHLRRHAAQRRPRQQRAAANGAGDRQLPHPARPLARGDASRRWCACSPIPR